jgi:hypothetical protein
MEVDQFERARKCAAHYRSIGLCPLPSKMHKKAPMLKTFTEHYEGTPVPEAVYSDWKTTNIQIITGTKSPSFLKLVVVDCDGPEAVEVWGRICEKHGYKPEGVWICKTGGNGMHTYFSAPLFSQPISSGMIWGVWDTWGREGKGDWLTHKEVRVLADNALVVAPPSIHVDSGLPYCFDGQANPNKIRIPAVAPQWLIDLPRLVSPRFQPDPPKPDYVPKPIVSNGEFYTRDEVIQAVGGNKLAEAKTWGLKTKCDFPNQAGWVSCWVPGREDPSRSSPSGSFNFRDGTLQDRKDLSTISFLDLGVVLGRYAKWEDCRDDLGSRYIGKRGKRPSSGNSYGS